ncbi:MAG TPA: alpha-L-fucosidase, partial [Flavisolibacter sp.]|nr:alpha-L-fucosidase [Flavisolibacter sp.]
MKANKFITLLMLFIYCCSVSLAQTAGDEEKETATAGKLRDQQAVDAALNSWWTASMKTHDQRIAWWREAKFGMFIHWGVYSAAGGEWKGRKVNGYAEHLMRKEKISRAEYLQLAHSFNPASFNADEWVRNARDAGMKYMIITSKHHDGFAMYPSSVSDFNIRQQTPFGRDPMAELSAACKKYGLKFGFYYSHAFDWEHPDAPGNDWEYRNPGGDSNLYGGREWYDLHPELLDKARKYVDEKAIPQIRELIAKYHPDILWFDTPQKLPLSENVRILRAIRDADPDVVVNGRLVRSASANFGDYKNTADRPAEFYPVTGDWEAIPTTNESYGYSKFDSSHKPVAHFVRLIASAASRGGNLLMNIGPKGDGTFDARDVKILKGIGSWMDKNGESVYGTTASSLPLQSWGVSTLKGGKLYLHVFDWPSDGKLYVGGLRSNPRRVYLLANGMALTSKRLNEKDLLVQLPSKRIDTANAVVVIELNSALQTDPVRYISLNTPVTRLLAFDATQQGRGFGFGDGKTDRYYVEGWKSKEQALSWDFRTTTRADYDIKIKYLAARESSGGVYAVALDQHYAQHYVTTDARSSTVITEDLGTISVSEGIHRLNIVPLMISKNELMKLLEVDLVHVDHDKVSIAKLFADAERQTRLMLQEIPKAKKGGSAANSATPGSNGSELVSPRTLDSGQLKLVSSRDWTSGFFPGQLWFLYEYTGKKEWADEARQFTSNIEREKTNSGTHDMGFKIYCSFGSGYRLTHDQHYRDVIIQSAKTLSTRFNPITGVIKSWDNRKWGYPVIVDNMMNLELLFAASKLSGDSSFYKIAVRHALTTMKNHYRKDYSSYHVVDYDTVTGQPISKVTHQGYADESAWARGQAWGLYGFTMCYRETRNKAFLDQAEHIASFLLNHPNLPKDGIPYWDFNAPNIPREPRDASAAAIMASALYELSQYSKNAKMYKQ